MASAEKRGHGLFNFISHQTMYNVLVEKSVGAEFRRVDRTVQIQNATEVMLLRSEYDRLNLFLLNSVFALIYWVMLVLVLKNFHLKSNKQVILHMLMTFSDNQ